MQFCRQHQAVASLEATLTQVCRHRRKLCSKHACKCRAALIKGGRQALMPLPGVM